MCNGHDLVFLGLQHLLNLAHTNSLTKIGAKLIDFSAVRLKARIRIELEPTDSYKLRMYAHQSAKLSPKYPVLSTRAFSPGSTRLAEIWGYCRVSRRSVARQTCRAYLVPPQCSGPGDEERLSGSRTHNLSARRTKYTRHARTLSTRHRLDGHRLSPCHANTVTEDCSEIRRHVGDRRMRIGIEDLCGLVELVYVWNVADPIV